MKAKQCSQALQALASAERAQSMQRFFKTGPGGYGEGDQFMGVPVPQQRAVARQFKDLPPAAVELLLHSPLHEERLTALFILEAQFKKASAAGQEAIVELLLRNTAAINNWDLVDSIAYQVLGQWLLSRERSLLYRLAASPNRWERRMAMVSCLAFIRAGEKEDCFAIARLLLGDPEDLVHKACGWMLKETGKHLGLDALRSFLEQHAGQVPRTMLRNAIEHMDAAERKKWLAAPAVH